MEVYSRVYGFLVGFIYQPLSFTFHSARPAAGEEHSLSEVLGCVEEDECPKRTGVLRGRRERWFLGRHPLAFAMRWQIY